MPGLKKCFVFDLDDTLADNGHRMHLLRSGNWDLYYAQCKHDPVIVHVAEIANALHAFGYAIVIISGRSESTRADTGRVKSKAGRRTIGCRPSASLLAKPRPANAGQPSRTDRPSPGPP